MDIPTSNLATSQNAMVSIVIRKQIGGTCYAHAVATVLRAAESRIVGRIPEDHVALSERIISKWGSNGAFPANIFKEECPKRQLRYKRIDASGCEKAIASKHPVLACFWLSETQWKNFYKFYREKRKGTLTAQDIGNCSPDEKLKGHAVVISGQTQGYWKLKNSWGSDSGDEGYFRVAKDAMKFEFHYVYSKKEDMTPTDIENYKEYKKKLKEEEKQRQLEVQKQKELEEEMKRIKEKEEEKQRQLELQKQKEREDEMKRQKEEEERIRQLEVQKQKELEEEMKRQKEEEEWQRRLEFLREEMKKQIEEEKQRQLELQKQKEQEEIQRQAELQKQKDTGSIKEKFHLISCVQLLLYSVYEQHLNKSN